MSLYIKPGDERPFPIQGGDSTRGPDGAVIYAKPSSIPWWLAEVVYAEYSRRYGTDQSLQVLANRGGFGRAEVVMFLRGPKGAAKPQQDPSPSNPQNEAL